MSLKSFNVLLKKKISPFNKTIFVDSDKSISIRSFLIGSISQNISGKKCSRVRGCSVYNQMFKKVRCRNKKIKNKNYSISGKGLGSLIIKQIQN